MKRVEGRGGKATNADRLYRRRTGRALFRAPDEEAAIPSTITVVERNKPYDTFGWGVVFSDAMMQAMRAADPESAAEIADAFNHWDDIELIFKGTRQRTTGHGFIGIGRKQLLEHPAAALRAARRRTRVRARRRFRPRVPRRRSHRRLRRDQFEDPRPIRRRRSSPISSCGRTATSGSARTSCSTPSPSIFARTEHGWFQAHIYKFDRDTSTFIVETTEDAFAAHGLGEARSAGIDRLLRTSIFAETLDGAKLMTNARHLRGSAWLNFNRLICGQWSRFNGRSHVVLMGDAAHTAHFAIGSGTKLALDDAIELARQFDALGHEPETYRRRRSPPTRRYAASTSRASRTRRATRWNGSRWSAGGTPTRSSPNSSSIPC